MQYSLHIMLCLWYEVQDVWTYIKLDVIMLFVNVIGVVID